MFWADQIAEKLKERKLPLERVDDMKTPSGKIHVGALRGVIIHDLIFRALVDAGVKAKYTYVFDDHDPMDALPATLSAEKFGKYLGFPLNTIPSPKPGFASFAEFYALEFKEVFNKLGAKPEIIWTSHLYKSGKMDQGIKKCLDNASRIRKIYKKIAGADLASDWYPFNVICQNCGKVGTTKVYNWDGKKVSYKCLPDYVKWVQGCGFEGKISPFGGTGKLPWKVEWAVKWQAIGVTAEGAGKDHMSKGGSHDIASAVCQQVLNYPVPYPLAYEWFLARGTKMSTSRGVGISAQEISEILPPEILRFLMVRTNFRQAINFDPGGETIPDLFDEYDRCGKEFFEKGKEGDFGRIFELSQINSKKPEKPVAVRFCQIAQWVQMPNMRQKIEKDPLLAKRAKYGKIWLERFAPDEEKFEVKEELPRAVGKLTPSQRQLLVKIANELDKKWEAEKFQNTIYQWGKELGLTSAQTFQAIYLSLLGKDHGPKAAWLILSLDKEFIKKRFKQQ
ncbi:lysine--tRNA ligase [Candidatus Gottesmanbacteria bacterium]|nr:lysine--tRNA ligase [Candidatus Gottesmanbacteria bacterium]